jgi:DNA-binding Lrp family transcriptional regulator
MIVKGPAGETKVNLDEKDRKILRLLMRDPRISVADIARDVGAQRDTVMYRIRRFEKRGLIAKYHTILEPQALGLNIFMMVLIKVAPVSREKIDAFIKKLVAHKNVTHIGRLVGKYDYFLQMAAEDIATFDRALDEVKALHEGLIINAEISNIIDGIKIDDFSGLI